MCEFGCPVRGVPGLCSTEYPLLDDVDVLSVKGDRRSGNSEASEWLRSSELLLTANVTCRPSDRGAEPGTRSADGGISRPDVDCTTGVIGITGVCTATPLEDAGISSSAEASKSERRVRAVLRDPLCPFSTPGAQPVSRINHKHACCPKLSLAGLGEFARIGDIPRSKPGDRSEAGAIAVKDHT